MRSWEKYVGIPFKDMGRTLKGTDCWGLVCLVMKQEANIDLPTYGEISARDLLRVTGKIAGESAAEPWVPVSDELRALDVAVMHKRMKPNHVGIMASEKLLLHIEQATLSVLLPLNSPSLQFRSIRFFRHRELA